MIRTLLLLTLCSSLLSAAQQPNIIFILCDDLGYGDIGVFFQNERARADEAGEPAHFTPQLDKMAIEGAMLPHHYSAAPVCAPARASLLAGVHQGHANVRNNQFDKELEYNHTLASVLQQSGYATLAVGKWGLRGKPSDTNKNGYIAHPLNRGFDAFFGYLTHKDGHQHYPKEDGKSLIDNTQDVVADYDKCYSTDLFTARTKKWIIDHTKSQPDQPFFAYLSYDTPHAKLQVPTTEYPSGGGLNGGLQWTGQSGSMINTAKGTPDTWIHPDYKSARWNGGGKASQKNKPWPDVYQRYATMVRRIDDCVGDLIHLLKDLNIDNNTLIVFTSDNGPSKESYMKEGYAPNFFNSFGPFDGIKRDLWEGGIRVGALARWPGAIPAGTISEHPSAFWDWMPTFTEMAGHPAPARSDGVSLLPTLTGKGEQNGNALYFEYQKDNKTPNYSEFLKSHRNRKRNNMQAIRIGDFVGVRYDIQTPSDPFEIYNVVRDPQQSQDLAMERTDLQKEMQAGTLHMRRANTTAKRIYDTTPMPAVFVQHLQSGLTWQRFEIDTPWVANTDGLTPYESGATPSLTPATIQDSKSSQLLIKGYLDVPETGEYTFTLQSGCKAVIRIHEAILFDADKAYSPGANRSTTIYLEKGLHPIRCYQKLTDSNMWTLTWAGPNMAERSIPTSAFKRDR
ncbi:MAG: sulfatase-like hydrolase/transferase [Opitutaceae bacterium]